jgi:hypothetical protein
MYFVFEIIVAILVSFLGSHYYVLGVEDSKAEFVKCIQGPYLNHPIYSQLRCQLVYVGNPPHSSSSTTTPKPKTGRQYYSTSLKVRDMKCDTVCDKRLWKNSTKTSTVIHDVRELQAYLDSRHTSKKVLSFCKEWSQDSDGMWVRRELWNELWNLRHPEKNTTNITPWRKSGGGGGAASSVESEEYAQQVEVLSEVMSGDLTQALNWPAVWIPRTCRPHRYNISTFLQYTHIHSDPSLPLSLSTSLVLHLEL